MALSETVSEASGSDFPASSRGCEPPSHSAAACARNTMTASAAADWRNGNGSPARRSSAGSASICGCWRRNATSRECPQILGIDEHFFTRRHGYATTFCDLKNHKVYDVVPGRSEASLERLFKRAGRQASGEGGVHGSGDGLSLAGAKAFPAGAHRGRSVSCDPHGQSPLPGLLEGTGSGRIKESRAAVADAAPPAQSEAGAARAAFAVPERTSGAGSDLPFQTEALLSAV